MLETGKDAAIPLTLPILILVGILGGIFTATEAGAIAAFWSIVLAMFLYRTIKLGNLLDTFRIAGKRSAMLMFIVATSTLLGWYLTNQRIPQDIAQAILGISENYWVVLAAINIFFLLAGTIIHGTPAILMLVPIFLPLADQLGIDRVHFGLILTINLGNRATDAAGGLGRADHLRHREDIHRQDHPLDAGLHRRDACGADPRERLPGHRALAALGHPVMRLLIVNPNTTPGRDGADRCGGAGGGKTGRPVHDGLGGFRPGPDRDRSRCRGGHPRRPAGDRRP